MCFPCFAAEVVEVVPNTVPSVDVESPQAAQAGIGRMKSSDRRLARAVRNDAAEAMGMRRLEFMRAVIDDDQEANDQLKLSLAEQDDAIKFDPDEFGQFLEMIIQFIERLLAIFSMFASNPSMTLLYLC
jgi:hypothetical protein